MSENDFVTDATRIPAGHTDAEVSLIDYARYHGLCQDYLSVNPLADESMRIHPPLSVLDLDISSLPRTDLTFDATSLDEKWLIDRQSALFLKEVMSPWNATILPAKMSQRHAYKAFKLEPPLLSKDTDLEQRMYRRKLRGGEHLGQSLDAHVWGESELLSQLEWPSPDLPTELMDQIRHEKLQLGRADVLFLQECTSPGRQIDDHPPGRPRIYQTRPDLPSVHQSPPLLPLSSPFIPGIPDSPVSQMRLATSPGDPTAHRITEFEEAMQAEDALYSVSPSDLCKINSDDYEKALSQLSKTPAHESMLLKRKRPEDVRVEVPLSPCTDSSPTKRLKTVSFPADLCTTIPDYLKPFSSEDSKVAEKARTEFFEGVIRSGAESAVCQIEHEQLMEVDSTMRVGVPSIDHTVPLAPWEVFSRKRLGCQTELDAQRRLVSMLRREIVRPHDMWPGVAKVDKGITRWRPFDKHVARIQEESISVDTLDQFVVRLSALEATTLSWKPEGLRTLDILEGDTDEIDYRETPTRKTVDDNEAVLETRSSDMRTRALPGEEVLCLRKATLPYVTASAEDDVDRRAEIAGKDSILGGPFSASASLDRFMQTQTGKPVTTKAVQQTTWEVKTATDKAVEKVEPLGAKACEAISESHQHATVPLPIMEIVPTPRSFILSSTMLERRSLLRELERLNPVAKSVERDFTASLAVRGLGNRGPESEEADFIIAPGCGLLLTTLQKIKQNSLPGQAARNSVQERIIRLAPRYERLLVLIHEDRTMSSRPPENGQMTQHMDERDCGALVSLIRFSAIQVHAVQVLYVQGDESALATWIISCMVRFGLDDTEIQLVQEETFWEVFLRRAGMDVFAAQVILSKLKRPDPLPIDCKITDYGLPAFILMSQAERIARFSGIVNGENILRKVSRAIDGRWAPAVSQSSVESSNILKRL